jgi:hypothetical protein
MCDRIYIYSYILAGAQRDGIDLPPGEFRIILSGAVCVCVCVCVYVCACVCVCVFVYVPSPRYSDYFLLLALLVPKYKY